MSSILLAELFLNQDFDTTGLRAVDYKNPLSEKLFLKQELYYITGLQAVIYIMREIKPSFYYPCVAVEKVLAVEDF